MSLFTGSNIAVDIKIQVTAPSDNPEGGRDPGRRPPPPPTSPAANVVPTVRKTGVGPMMRPVGEAMMVARQRSEMATHVSKFTSKFRKRSNTR